MSQGAEERKIFSQREKLLLTNLVAQYKHIIESKKTDNINLQQKQEVWNLICSGYNSNDVYKRTPKQLKKLWDNIKQKTRKADTQRKNAILKTGGGPPPEDDPNPLFDNVRLIVPGIDFEIENCWDSISSFKTTDSEKVEHETSELSLASTDHDYSEKKDGAPETVRDCQSSSSNTNTHYSDGKNETDQNELENNSCSPVPKKRKLTKKQPLKNSNIFIEEEASLRIKKIKEAIEHQSELHAIKMETAITEKEYWTIKLVQLKDSV